MQLLSICVKNLRGTPRKHTLASVDFQLDYAYILWTDTKQSASGLCAVQYPQTNIHTLLVVSGILEIISLRFHSIALDEAFHADFLFTFHWCLSMCESQITPGVSEDAIFSPDTSTERDTRGGGVRSSSRLFNGTRMFPEMTRNIWPYTKIDQATDPA